jgi:hypothetical protein
MGMRILKIMVVLGGILVVAGSIIMLTQIYGNSPDSAKQKSASESLESHIALPAGGEIISSSPIGAGISLLVKLPSGGGQLLMVNQKGQLWRRVFLEPELVKKSNP